MYLKKLLFIVFLSLLCCSQSVENWNNEIKEKKKEQGWLPVLEQYNGKRIAFIKPFSVQKIDNGIFYVKILWVNHETISDGYPEDIFLAIEDCINKRSAILESYSSIKNIDLSALEWRKIEGDQLQPKLCESFMKYQ